MLNIWQRDPKWRHTLIGKSKTEIGEAGCLICALCDLWSKFHYGPKQKIYLRPDEASKEWIFGVLRDSDGKIIDKEPKYLYWAQTDFDGMQFVWRNYGYNPTGLMEDPETGLIEIESELIRKYLNSSNYGVVFRVVTKSGGEHWVAGWKWNIFGKPTCLDPWTKKTLWIPWGFGGTYVRCTGWAVLKKTD